jgi:hypothetical protein
MRSFILLSLLAAFFLGMADGNGALHAQEPVGLSLLESDSAAAEYARLGSRENPAWEDLAAAALWASSGGTDSASSSVGSAMEQIRRAVQELLKAPDLPQDRAERGNYILNFMYRRYLNRYTASQTRLDVLLRAGTYNCVSSAVFYLILAQAAGMKPRGVVTRDHAFIHLDPPGVDVETTNAGGFDPGTRQEFHDGFGRLTGFSYVPARNYRDRTPISPLELISLIFTNRIADLEGRDLYSQALPLALNRAVLLSQRRNPTISPFFPDPQKDMNDRLLNYGASLIQGAREEAALEWGRTARNRFPELAEHYGDQWGEYTLAALNNLVVRHIRVKNFDAARVALDTYGAALNPADYRRLAGQITEGELVILVGNPGSAEEIDRALERLARAQEGREIPAARAAELRSALAVNLANRYGNQDGYLTGLRYLEGVVNRYGETPQLRNALNIFRSNRVAVLHNRFVEAFNRRDNDRARELLQAALAEFPNDRQLLSDKSQLPPVGFIGR